jgi:hypothetical protein
MFSTPRVCPGATLSKHSQVLAERSPTQRVDRGSLVGQSGSSSPTQIRTATAQDGLGSSEACTLPYCPKTCRRQDDLTGTLVLEFVVLFIYRFIRLQNY